jgi:hypothetical protein
MRSKRLLGLAVTGLALGVLVAPGCGDDGASDGTGGSGNAGGSGGAGGTGNVGGTGNAGGDGGGGAGGMGDGNDSFAEAADASYGTLIEDVLDPADSDMDYFKFSGNEGDLIAIFTDAKPDADEFSGEYPDLVITLYDADQQKIAENDDPFLIRDTNDSLLYTRLPATGDYYIRVTDCLAWENGGADNCAPADAIVNHDYLVLFDLVENFWDGGLIEDTEAGDNAASADQMPYVLDTAGDYFGSLAYGTFNDNSDVDVYQLVIPNDVAVDNALSAAVTIMGPEGPDGMGTTNNVGDAWIEDNNGNILSWIDNTLGADESARDLRSLVTGNSTYYLFVSHPGTAAGVHDFYITFHGVGDTNPLEPSPDNNDTQGTATALTAATQAGSELISAYVEGTLAANNLDYYTIAYPTDASFDATTWTLAVACGAERSGSGLRGFTASVLKADGTAWLDADGNSATALESASEDIFLFDIPLDDTESGVTIKLEGTTPDATVLSRFYQCGYHFVPPAPAP